ncbi:MAG TPA: IclR family transcriptional regulator C-terminal domain-containing protein [Streptosporangiaceae bacterium]|nr:IclR family transcriptional regulator C-terminal domain-containing protein [Streptosporangiaceae bacterium]
MPASDGARRERNPIAAVVRLLGALAEHHDSTAGVRELARVLGTAPSSVQRTLEAAHEVSLVAVAENGQWELGWELYRIAAIAQSKRPYQAAAAVLESLAKQTSETAVLTVYDPQRRARMYVAASPSQHSVRFVPDLFTWLPAYAGASATAILAFRPEAEQEAVYALADTFSAIAAAPDAGDLRASLREIRKRGYAISHDEVNLGASAVAAPVRSSFGITSSVAVIAPKQRFDSAPQDAIIKSVMEAADAIGHRIGDPLAPLGAV